MKLLLLILLLFAGVYVTWYDYIAPHFPREITLTNKDGDVLKVTLIRRDEINVYFRRQEDPTLYNCEIAKLNFLSRCKVKLYLRSLPKPLPKPLPLQVDDPAQKHLNSMYEKREDLKEQIRLLKVKMGRETDRAARRAIAIEIEAHKLEIANLTYKIEHLEYRYPHLIRSK